MAKINIDGAGGSGGSVATGVLQLQGGTAMSVTPTVVTDQNGTASTLYLGTTITQVQSPLRVTTNNAIYLDVEDGSGNNRFTVGRDPASQEVTLDFASNPTGSTTVVGAIRTYVDGVNLSEIMTFREDGNIGINTLTPGAQLDVHSASNVIAQFNRTGAGKSWIQYLQAGSGKWNTGYDNTNGNFTIYDVVNATDRVVVTNTGRLGVGTNAPAQTLQVLAPNNSTITKLATAQNGIQIIDATTLYGVNAFGIYGANVTPSSTNYILHNVIDVYTRLNGGQIDLAVNGTSRLTVLSSGSVGIGTTTPTARTHIVGSGSTSATTSLLVQNSAGTQTLKVDDAGNTTSRSFTQNAGDFSTIISGTNFSIYTAGGTIQYNGNSQFINNLSVNGQLSMSSTTQGFLPPRMTTTQKNAIASPAAGLMVYDTTLNKLCVYTTAWETITSI